MNNIETTMKINTLMRELKKHGIAVSSEDAYKKAEHLVSLGDKTKKTKTSEYEIMFETKKPEVKKENVENEKVEEKMTVHTQVATPPPQNSALLQKQVEIMIDMQTKKFVNTISELQNKMLSMQTEMSNLRNELSAVKSMKVERLDNMDKKTKQAAAAPSQKVLHQETEKKSEHPRQGKFQPGCIDIKKYFYYGNK